MIGRREFLKATAASAAMTKVSFAFAQDKPKPRTRVVFLGTKGGPRVTTGRSNPASVLLVNGSPYVIDCGMGVSRQLAAAGVPLTSIKNIFITHMHSDHNLEYGNLVYNAWTSGLQTPIHSYGPKGLIRYSFTYWELNRFDIETRIERSERLTKDLPPEIHAPSGIPESYEEHIRTMFDILTLAFQTDSTRVSTFLLAHDGSNRSFPEIGVPDNHHGISHHQHDPEKLRKIALIDSFYLRQLAYFMAKLKATKEGDGNLLDNSMIVYGSGISDPDRHDHSKLPVILAGRGRGTLNPGSHVALAANETPMTNLYLALLERMGVPAERIGDSTGKLEGI